MEFKKLINDEEHKINSDTFSLRQLKVLLECKGFDRNGEPLGIEDAKKYMLRYLFPCEGGIILNSNKKLEFKTTDIMNKTYYSRIDKKLMKWFRTETLDIYTRVCIPNRQLIKDYTINMIPAFRHQKDIKYEDIDQETKNNVNKAITFIKHVWCSNDEVQLEYILNWIANVCQGKKNHTILYAKTITEGVGKSTLSEFLSVYVLGRSLAVPGDSNMLKTGNNHALYGKLLVTFEELASTYAEWTKMSSCLKEWATGDTIQYNEKYMVGFSGANLNNYIINTNTEAVKGANGRRYMVCDLSTRYVGNTDYWEDLNDSIMDTDTGKAFYIMMCERDVSRFNSSKLPKTAKRKEYISELLIPAHKFIKFNYLLCNKEIKRVSTKDLYSQYKLYCGNTDVKIGTQRNFNGAMSELNFKYKTSNSKMFYNITLDELKEVARVRGWLSDMDADQMGDHVIWEERKTVAEMASENNLFFDAKSYEDIIEQKDKQLEQKDREIEELKRLLKQQQEPAEKPKKKSKREEPKEKSKKKSKRKEPKEKELSDRDKYADAYDSIMYF
jgi:hypothetical protein